jgi:ribonuclease-3
MRAELDSLEAAIGYRFAARDILVRALTHSSRIYEKAVAGQPEPRRDNERMEFLGDAVLGFLVSEWLIARFPDASEGRLTKLKALLVRASHLHEVARELDLGSYLHLGKGEELSGGRSKHNLLADAAEALIAAIYLDGGMPAARAFIERFVLPPQDALAALEHSVMDFRIALEELTQTRNLPRPRYSMSESGPGHAKTFTVEVRVGEWVSQAAGLTKKSAAQEAAREAYERLVQR